MLMTGMNWESMAEITARFEETDGREEPQFNRYSEERVEQIPSDGSD
jgi:hypothetical protein